jgi:ABC-type sugar transport system permease subunit
MKGCKIMDSCETNKITPSKKPRVIKKHKYQYQAFLWMLPAAILLLVFSYYPPVKAFIDSFFDTTRLGKTVFVGLSNYKEFLSDSMFWICVKNTFIFTAVGLVCGNVMTIFLAELMYNLRSKRISSFFRVLFIIPILVPSMVIYMIWKNIVFGSNGFINQIIIAQGGDPLLFYWDRTSSFWPKFAIIMTNFPWVAGTSFLIYLAGLQNIPTSVVEASRLDHCSTWKRIFKIDLPLIKSQLKYFLIMGVIGGIQNFDVQLIIVGAEYKESNVLGLYIYNHAFGFGYDYSRFGYASAVGMFVFALTLILTIINNHKKKEKVK